MANENEVSDAELESLMAELEAQNAELMAQTKPAAPAAPAEPEVQPAPEKAIEEPVAAAPEPEPEPAVPAEEPEINTAASVGASDVGAPEPFPEPKPAAAERRVIVDDKGDVVQPAMKFDAKPTEPRPTEAAGGLKHYIDVDQFRKDTRVTDVNLDQCMIEQNGLRAYYGAQAAYAEAQYGRIKARFEVVEATLYDHHRKDLAASGEKTTEKMVENAVKMDGRWLKAKNLVIEAETIAAINKGLVESLKDRRDMIIQLGADRRDEYKGAARVMAEQNERDELRDRANGAARRSMAG